MRYLIGAFLLGCGVVALVLSTASEASALHIVSVRETHTYTMQEDRTLAFEFLANRDDTHHFLEEAIHGAGIVDLAGVKRYPLELVSVEKSVRPFEGEVYHHYRLFFSPTITGGLSTLSIPKGALELSYGRFKPLKLPIGEFNVTYEETIGDALSLQAIRAVPGNEGHGLSAKGMFLTLENTAGSDAVIDEVSLNSKHVLPDLAAARGMEDSGPPDDFEKLFDGYERFKRPEKAEVLVPAGETKTIFVPFSYVEATLLHRFPLQVSYRIDYQSGRLMFEDFLFINTNRFACENEEAFYHVRPD